MEKPGTLTTSFKVNEPSMTSGISPTQNPNGPERGRFKVIRGGSWHSGGMCIQSFYRNGLSPSWVDFAVGIRCVKKY